MSQVQILLRLKAKEWSARERKQPVSLGFGQEGARRISQGPWRKVVEVWCAPSWVLSGGLQLSAELKRHNSSVRWRALNLLKKTAAEGACQVTVLTTDLADNAGKR